MKKNEKYDIMRMNIVDVRAELRQYDLSLKRFRLWGIIKSLTTAEWFERSDDVDQLLYENPRGPEDDRAVSGNGERQYRLKPGYAVRAFMDEYLVIPVGSPGADDAKMAVLSPVAEFIWSLLEEPRTFGELLKAVTDDFEVSAEIAEPDIREFLQELEANGFLA